jgi:hypothetical protein
VPPLPRARPPGGLKDVQRCWPGAHVPKYCRALVPYLSLSRRHEPALPSFVVASAGCDPLCVETLPCAGFHDVITVAASTVAAWPRSAVLPAPDLRAISGSRNLAALPRRRPSHNAAAAPLHPHSQLPHGCQRQPQLNSVQVVTTGRHFLRPPPTRCPAGPCPKAAPCQSLPYWTEARGGRIPRA